MLLNMLSNSGQTNFSGDFVNKNSQFEGMSYPQEAYSNQTQQNEQNFFPMLLSMMKNNSPLSQIFSEKKEKSKIEETSLPNDEILL